MSGLSLGSFLSSPVFGFPCRSRSGMPVRIHVLCVVSPESGARAGCCGAVCRCEVGILGHGASHAVGRLGTVRSGMRWPVRACNVSRIAGSSLRYAFSGICCPAPPYTGLARFVPPPRGTTAPPCPGLPWSSGTVLRVLARPPGASPLSRRGSVAFPSSSRTSSTLRRRLHVLWYRCDGYLIEISFSWLDRSSQGPFLRSHRIRECVQQSGAPVRGGRMSKGERAPCAAYQGYSLAFPTV